MFLSAAARVWNEAAAHRLSTLGFAARRGDLVWLQEERGRAEDSAAPTTLPQVMGRRNGQNTRSGSPSYEIHFYVIMAENLDGRNVEPAQV